MSKWVHARGYGFVTGADGKEVFVHNAALQGGRRLIVGKKVTYEIDEEANEKKKGDGPTPVKNVAGEGVLANSAGGSDTGTVLKWFRDKSYGFIAHSNGDTIYVHRSSFDGTRLSVGKEVTFDLAPDANHDSGRGIAVNLTGPGVVA